MKSQFLTFLPKQTLFFSIVFVVFALPTFGQTNGNQKFQKVTFDNARMSIVLPDDLVVNNDPKWKSASIRGSVGVVFVACLFQETNTGKKWLETEIEGEKQPSVEDVTYKLGSYKIRVLSLKKNNYYLRLQAATGSRYFSIEISSSKLGDPNIERLLSSIELDGKRFFEKSNAAPFEASKSVDALELATSEIVKEALKNEQTKKAEVKYSGDTKEEPIGARVYSRAIMMLSKPKPSYTDNARMNGVTGTVKLLLRFEADGTIGRITVIRELPHGLTNQSISAANRIKFLPAQIEGKNVSFSKVLEYTFSIY